MSSNIFLLVVYILLALGFSFLCSVAESVLLSVTPSFIETQKFKNPKKAALLKQLKQDNIDRSLAAILTLNTIAHTAGSIGAGAQAAVVFGNTWFGVFSALMTLAILFLSEIIPKTIGAVYWSELSGITVYFVKYLILILYPFVRISEEITKIISRGQNVHIFSREEFIAMSRLGEETGQIYTNEAKIIKNLFLFSSLKASDIMTPRIVLSALPETTPLSEASGIITSSPFSRFPVYKENIDHITGFVLKEDILLSLGKEKSNETLNAYKRDILFFPQSSPLSSILENFLKKRRHLAIIIDEYGGTSGIVTLEDIVETLMGHEIIDESDTVADMQELAKSKWEKRAKKMEMENLSEGDYKNDNPK
jgi:CBS domain containing-hemolysin-like protein